MIAVMLDIDKPALKADATYYKDLEDHWASGNIESLYYYGIIDDFDQENFNPNASITRAEAVVMINQLFYRGPLITDKKVFADLTGEEWYYYHILEASILHNYHMVDQHEEEVK